MTDQPQAETQTGENQEAPVPSAETNPEVQAEAVPQAEPSQEIGELPEGAKDRTTEQFDKLKEQLAQERTKRLDYEKHFQRQQTQIQPVSEGDPVATLQQRQQQLEQQIYQQEQVRQERETFAVHPELDPKSKDFDDKLHRVTRSILQDSYMNPQDYGNRELSFKEAADAAKQLGQADEKGQQAAEKRGAKQAIEGLSDKEQASLEASGRSDKRVNTGNIDDLKYRSRRGDQTAIAERLSKLSSV